MNIQPTEFKVLIKPDKVEGQTSGGLYLPDSARDKQQFSVDRGTIISFGEGFFRDLPGPIPKAGDKVIFNRYAGSLIKSDGDDYRLCNDKDICAIMEE
jgi:chaperonin GroES